MRLYLVGRRSLPRRERIAHVFLTFLTQTTGDRFNEAVILGAVATGIEMGKILSRDAFSGKASGRKAGHASNGIPQFRPGCELATFGAGPFWSVEPAFKSLDGVLETMLGYAGGNLPYPTYLDVFCEQSGHAEVVQVRYDRSKLTYTNLLETFWTCHDPTQLNRQGPDIGIQYRSVIFCHNGAQAILARRSRDRKEQDGTFRYPIVTQIEQLQHFWPAEEILQDYPGEDDRQDTSQACPPKLSNPRSGS